MDHLPGPGGGGEASPGLGNMGSFKIEGPRGPLGFGFWVQGLGFRVLGFGFRDCTEIRGVSVQSDVGHIWTSPHIPGCSGSGCQVLVLAGYSSSKHGIHEKHGVGVRARQKEAPAWPAAISPSTKS